MTTEAKKYLDPKIINKISQLNLKARHIVEGFLAGMHKSPYKGFSVEFAQHREYTPGDDLKHLDWKVYARSDRSYIKEYELETNLRSHIFLDASESMLYGSKEGMTKLDFASYVAASLAYLVINQQDAVSLAVFDREVRKFVPPGSSRSQLMPVLESLASATAEKKSDIGAVFNYFAERLKYKGLVIIISDLFDNVDNILAGLQHFRHKRHDVILFHILDEYETRFPFENMTLFEGLEEYPELLCDPHALRKAYLEEVDGFIAQLKAGCLKIHVDYEQLTTNQKQDVALSRYLVTRLKITKS